MPDERDWAKVVAEERCDECGLVAALVPQEELGESIVRESEQWGALLCDGDVDQLRRRPRAGMWTALEYGAHVRDVLALR